LTAGEAIALLDEFPVEVVSLHGPAEASSVIQLLIEQDAEGRDRWPAKRIAFHGKDATVAIEELIQAIDDHSLGCSGNEGTRGEALSRRGIRAP
jgi:hypothetical protein